jgi:hypothetical protein
MLNFKIKTHKHGRFYNTPHFFILNKGNNAGKPSFEPYRNAFVIFCNNQSDLQKLYWICAILHAGSLFKPYHKGSVITFVSICDIKNLIIECLFNYDGHYWQERFKVLKKLEEAEENLRKQSVNLKNYKILMMRSYQPQLN